MTSKSESTWIYQLATVGPVGKLPGFPGTWGSGFAVIFWWLALSRLSIIFQITFILALILPSVWLSGRAEDKLGHDARPIVIDEVLGQWIALINCPPNVIPMMAAFIAFRVFDILKPYPAGASQRLPGGWGIVMDDVIAGVYALIIVQLLLRLF